VVSDHAQVTGRLVLSWLLRTFVYSCVLFATHFVEPSNQAAASRQQAGSKQAASRQQFIGEVVVPSSKRQKHNWFANFNCFLITT
jgi:ribosomal protein L44E